MASITSSVAPFNSRALRDASLNVSVTPASAATTGSSTNTNAIDLQQATPYPVTEKFIVSVYNTALTGTGSAGINVSLQDSADNTTFTNIAVFNSTLLRITASAGSPGAGGAASSTNVQLPPTNRRYLRANILSENSSSVAGGFTGSVGVQLLF